MTRTNRIIVPSAVDMIEIMKKVGNGEAESIADTFWPETSGTLTVGSKSDGTPAANGYWNPRTYTNNTDHDQFAYINFTSDVGDGNAAVVLCLHKDPLITSSPWKNLKYIVAVSVQYIYLVTINWSGIVPKGYRLSFAYAEGTNLNDHEKNATGSFTLVRPAPRETRLAYVLNIN